MKSSLMMAALRFKEWKYCDDHPTFNASMETVLEQKIVDDRWEDFAPE